MSVILISNSGDIHCDFLVNACNRLNTVCFRLNTDRFRRNGIIDWNINEEHCILEIGPHRYDLSETSLLIYRRPVIAHQRRLDIQPWIARLLDSEWAAVESALSLAVKGPIINGLAGSVLAQNKIIQLQTAIKCLLDVPETIISTNAGSLRQFASRHRCVTKGIVNAFHFDGDKLRSAFTSVVDVNELESYDSKGKPTLLQRAIVPSAIWRVVVVGRKVIGFRFRGEELQKEADSRKVEHHLEGENLPVPDPTGPRLIEMCKALGIEFASSDFVEDSSGNLWFLDLNPEGQWAFLEDRFGTRISDEIIRLARPHEA